MSDQQTLQVYAKRAGEYARLTQSDGNVLLDAFMARIAPGGTLLDLGCGPGFVAGEMARAGFAVLATDAVAQMVALAAQYPGVRARRQTFDAPLGEDVFDGVWANFSLLHAPRADMPSHLARIHRALRPGGIFHLALKLGTGEARDSIGRLYTYYSEDELRILLFAAQFQVIDARFGCDVGLDGTSADWICLTSHG